MGGGGSSSSAHGTGGAAGGAAGQRGLPQQGGGGVARGAEVWLQHATPQQRWVFAHYDSLGRGEGLSPQDVQRLLGA